MSATAIHTLQTIAIVVAGTMTGNEIAVAVFVHPRLSRLEDAVHVRAVQSLAIGFGAAMPFWFALTCLLSLATTFFAQSTWDTPRWLALGATTLFIGMAIYSIVLDVPINNQVARFQLDSLPPNWRELRRRWDALHGICVGFLVIAFILLVVSCVIQPTA